MPLRLTVVDPGGTLHTFGVGVEGVRLHEDGYPSKGATENTCNRS